MRLKLTLPLILVLLCCLPAATPGARSNNGFTLEQVLSSPFPTDLIASKRGDKVAWVFYEQGRRNIWIAEAPLFKGRKLTSYDEDDGQEITEPAFSPDGNWIAFVHGGPPNDEKENPNPTSDARGANQTVRAVNLQNGATIDLGEGTNPFFSPRGERVMFIREDHIWSAPLLRTPAARAGSTATMLFEIRGEVKSPAWSPDGAQLAFVSSRGDHSFIGIFDPTSARIRFLEPGVDKDIDPRWSPDGKRIAFVRSFNVTDTYSADNERLHPWAIRVVDLSSGRGKEIWRSGNTEADSFSFSSGLGWAAGDRLVFSSEMDGWAHLYSIPAAGGSITNLTPGNFEVEETAWSTDRSFAVVATNAGDIDRRHLWRVGFDGSAPRQITRGEGSETYPVVVNAGKQIGFLGATANSPLLPYISGVDGNEAKMLAPGALPANFPLAQLVAPEQVIFKAKDGTEIHGQLFKARGATGKSPAVVFMHGGPIRQMLLTWHYLFYYHNAYGLNQYLASRGYTVLSVNYRCGVGYGRGFREAKHRGPRGASEYQDIAAAGKYLRSRSDVDSKRIALWGGSYGGFLTAMGLARDSDLFAAGVDIHGVHDWSVRVATMPGATSELIKLARESSPIADVDKWRSPVLLIHGDDDRNVAFSQTVDLVRKLRERGVDFEELVLPDEVHDLLLHASWLRAYHAAVDFFDQRLKP
jgi:dipeptidyl aminopeptidase/acylaminoacyl peptidase